MRTSRLRPHYCERELHQLEAAGYLKLRPDPADARARLVTLTKGGKKLLEAVRAAERPEKATRRRR